MLSLHCQDRDRLPKAHVLHDPKHECDVEFLQWMAKFVTRRFYIANQPIQNSEAICALC